jgi:small subunit ribosomal protein S2
MANIDKMTQEGTFDNVSKREKLQITRQRAKLEKNLGSIADMTRLPQALFVIDTQKEAIAVKEAKKLGIPVFGIVDTNGNPNEIDFVIPANADGTSSVEIILDQIIAAISEGLQERKDEKSAEDDAEAPVQKKSRVKKAKKDSEEASAE